jgi:hypothetical protein
MLWCCLVLSVDRINGFCVVDKSLRFLNTIYPWHWIKVYIDLGYCNPTHFQTRGPKVQKLMFLLFVHRELLIPPATSCRGVRNTTQVIVRHRRRCSKLKNLYLILLSCFWTIKYVWTIGFVYRRTDRRKDGQMDGRMDGRYDGK